MSWSPRSGGLAGLSAAGLLVLSVVLHPFAPDALFRTVVALAFVAVVGAVAGIHAAHRGRPRYGWLGALAAAVTATGYSIVAAVTAVAAFGDADSLFGLRVMGAVLVLAGSVVLGIVVMVARLMPRWCGALLIVGFPLGDIADGIVPTGESVVLALLWGSLGVALLSLAAHPARLRAPRSGGAVAQRSTMAG